ncbi:hypothetical protein [Leucobacter celer]|uniref:hypothetical protein n=1 Tax=Leucobacter celer TaxID=668625 RepID=UPI000AA03E35|nr:hypothetical protein [Leucobacter celer]
MSSTRPQSPSSGTLRLSQHNPNMWWFVLAAANGGALLLTLLLAVRPLGGSVVPGLLLGALVWIAANAVLIPIAVAQMRKHLILDFDRGALATGGRIHPSSEFQCAIETSRSYPGHARMLTLVYQRGSVEVQTDGFAPNGRTRARDEALLAFIQDWLPMPDRHRSPVDAGPFLTRQLIGKQEATALLRG